MASGLKVRSATLPWQALREREEECEALVKQLADLTAAQAEADLQLGKLELWRERCTTLQAQVTEVRLTTCTHTS